VYPSPFVTWREVIAPLYSPVILAALPETLPVTLPETLPVSGPVKEVAVTFPPIKRVLAVELFNVSRLPAEPLKINVPELAGTIVAVMFCGPTLVLAPENVITGSDTCPLLGVIEIFLSSSAIVVLQNV
jgi:hypothetical protein